MNGGGREREESEDRGERRMSKKKALLWLASGNLLLMLGCLVQP